MNTNWKHLILHGDCRQHIAGKMSRRKLTQQPILTHPSTFLPTYTLTDLPIHSIHPIFTSYAVRIQNYETLDGFRESLVDSLMLVHATSTMTCPTSLLTCLVLHKPFYNHTTVAKPRENVVICLIHADPTREPCPDRPHPSVNMSGPV